MKIVGLDLSLTGTGVAVVLTDQASPLSSSVAWQEVSAKDGVYVKTELIKTIPKSFKHRWDRITSIIKRIEETVGSDPADLYLIEDYFVGLHGGTATELIELGGIVRHCLATASRRFFTAAPSQLKKFMTGKGVGDKGLVMVNLFKRYGVSADDNNSADASTAALLGEALLRQEKGLPTDDLTKAQLETMKKVIARGEYT